jgi:hypothetical protein
VGTGPIELAGVFVDPGSPSHISNMQNFMVFRNFNFGQETAVNLYRLEGR